MAKGAAKDIELLLVVGGGWLVAMESQTVRRVEAVPDRPDTTVSWLADLLGTAPTGPSKDRRALALAPEGRYRLVVDRVVGVHPVPEAALCKMPKTLRDLGVPDWLVGSYWRAEHELVLLMEPSSAVEPHNRGRGA